LQFEANQSATIGRGKPSRFHRQDFVYGKSLR